MALRGIGRSDPAKVDRRTWRASVGLDLAAIGAGMALAPARGRGSGCRAGGPHGRLVALGHRPVGGDRGRAPGADRPPGRHPGPSHPGGAVRQGGHGRDQRLPAPALERQFPGVGADEDLDVGGQSLAMSLGVTAALTGPGAGERVFATAVGVRLEQVLPGHERQYRPLGHLAALSVIGGGLYERDAAGRPQDRAGSRGAPGRLRRGADLQLVSGGPGGGVVWDTLSRQGPRNVATVLSTEAIEEQVMGEPAAAEPIRVFVGLESAEAERVARAMAELERTGAWDRSLLMVISPTGTGYVNYVAVESAEYLTRGDMASVTMQYSLRPSPLSLDRVAEGHPPPLPDAARRHPQHPRPAAARKRPRMVLFGESLGAWTSQDAFAHRGTQGLLVRRGGPGFLDRHPLHEQVEGRGAQERPARRRPQPGRPVQRLRRARGAGPRGSREAALCDDHPRQRRRQPLRPRPAGPGPGLAQPGRGPRPPPSPGPSSGAARPPSSRRWST